MLNAFTIDVEDYFHVQAFADRVDRRRWDQYESRVVTNTQRILQLLEKHQTRATFFILGWVAERYPTLVRDIQTGGHEIGCHSYWHRLIYEMTPEEFRDDLLQATDALQQITGRRVVAFRAPSFSITIRSLWALEILADEGYRYDSSIFPVHHDRYGIPDAQRFPHRLCFDQHSPTSTPSPPTSDSDVRTLQEFPPSVHRIWKYNVPVAGGGYFRLYPLQLSLRLLARINQVEQQPFMFYVHPWELDPDQPRLPASPRSRFRHYQNLKTTEAKLDRLLSRFRFGSMSDALRSINKPQARVPQLHQPS